MERRFGDDILKDVREFVQFFRSLWGLLAGGSLFFPFINAFVEALPYPDPSVRKACAAFSLLASAFVFLMVYTNRSAVLVLARAELIPRRMRRNQQWRFTGCWSSFLAIACFCVFVMLLLLYLRDVSADLYQTGSVGADRGVLMYGMIFVFATLSFTLPATVEFMKRTEEMKRAHKEPPPSPYLAHQAILSRLPDAERPRYQSQLKVAEERVFEEGGKMMLTMTVESQTGTKYRAIVDTGGTVHLFERLDS